MSSRVGSAVGAFLLAAMASLAACIATIYVVSQIGFAIWSGGDSAMAMFLTVLSIPVVGVASVVLMTSLNRRSGQFSNVEKLSWKRRT
jgi:hypothetical protein